MAELLSFKKRAIIALLFGVFFILLLLISIFAKKGNLLPATNMPTPTLVPIEIKDNHPTTESIKIESSPSAQNNELGEVFFDYQTKNIPTSGTVYTQAPTSIPAETIAKIQEKLIAGGTERIINTPNGQVIFMQKDTKTLTIYLYSRTVSYSNGEDDPATPPVSMDLLVKKAADFISTLQLPFDKTEPTIKYFSNNTGDLIQVSSITDADLIDISFRELVSGLTVFRQFGSSASTHVWFSKSGVIKKFTYFYTPQYVPQKSVLLPTLPQTEESIKKGKGVIVGLGADYQQPQLTTPTKTTLTSVEVGYFNDGKDALLFPIYIFKGNALIRGVSAPITVYLPATN